jgi:hypothetical protein
MKPIDICFEHCRVFVDIDNKYMKTVFQDGSIVDARPNEGEADLWWLHDLLHCMVAESCGTVSAALWAAAHHEPPNAETDAEEKFIIEMQKRGGSAMLEFLSTQ